VVDGLGRHFEPGSEDSLAECIQYAVDHPAETEASRAPMRARVETVYSWDAIADSYERLFESASSGGAEAGSSPV
jgi:glycosyltransferase involved in cell wall biosynthesis